MYSYSIFLMYSYSAALKVNLFGFLEWSSWAKTFLFAGLLLLSTSVDSANQSGDSANHKDVNHQDGGLQVSTSADSVNHQGGGRHW